MGTVRIPLHPEEAQFATSAFPAYVRTAGTNFPVSGLAFDASAATETAYWKFPAFSYGSGNLTCDIDWYADTATSGNIVWEAKIAAITPDTDSQDVETKAFATALTVTDSHLGTTGQRLHRASITVSNLDSIAALDVVWIAISRLGSNASDTMTGDAIMVLAEISYSDT